MNRGEWEGIEMFYVTILSTHNYNHSLQSRSRELREGFHDVGYAFQLNIAANPPRVVVLNFQLVNNNRATLDAVSTKQGQIVVHMLLAVARKIQERTILSTQVADFIFIICS